MNQENQVSLKEFSLLAGNVASFWYALDMKGYYLPHLFSSVMTSEYLFEVMRGKVFIIEKKNIQKCALLQNSSKVDLYIKLKALGFRVRSLPNKEWLVSVLYVLNPIDQVFLKPKIEDVRCSASGKGGFTVIFMLSRLLKQLDTTLVCFKKPEFLKRTEEQRIAISEKKSEQKFQRLKQKVDKKKI